MDITNEQIEALRSEAAAGDEAQVAICERAMTGDDEARQECAGVIAEARAAMEDADLVAETLDDVFCVRDPAGGVWWPYDEAQAEIERSEDPGATAVRICKEQPMRGRWHQ